MRISCTKSISASRGVRLQRVVFRVLGLFGCGLALSTGFLHGEPSARPPDPVEEAVSGFEESIRLRERLSRERLRHRRQVEVLESEVRLLENEIAETRRRIEEARASRSEARARRERLLASTQEEERKLGALRELAEELRPLLAEIETALPPWVGSGLPPADAPPGETFRHLLRRLADNEGVRVRGWEVADPSDPDGTVLVDLLEIGYGGAFFCSPDGSFGGRFVFDGQEWSPEVIEEFAARVHGAVSQQEGLAEPGFVSLPVAIGGVR